MGKVVKVVAAVAAVAVAFVPGAGPALSGALVSAMGGTFASIGIASAIVGGIATLGIMSAVGIATKALGLGPKPPKAPQASLDRLRATLDPRAYRKIVLGQTASAVDVHYQEFSGSNQEYLDSVITLASHKLQSIDEIWFDSDLAWSSASGVAAKFSGYLTVTTRTEGTAGNAVAVGSGASWRADNGRLTGCAYIILRYKLTGNSKKAESPFAQSITSRITVRTRGALLYDPRRDSTAGGSGSHRANDQTTWAWVDDLTGRNPALQILWYLLGWKINGKLAVGRGLPPARIDLASFIAAANICDETVSLAAGGTERRYRADGVASEGDDPSIVFDNLLAACNGVLRDAGGQIRLDILTNDLATPVHAFTASDVVGAFNWIQTPPVSETFNVVRGQYTNSTNASLYQMADYPEISIASPDGIERSAQFDLAFVQSATQAQRVAKTFLQRAQFPGTFSAEFMATAWRVQVGSLVTLTFPALGFSAKAFRVIDHKLRFDGIVEMVLREENAAIYAWSTGDESAAVVASPPISYNPLNDPLISSVGDLVDPMQNLLYNGDFTVGFDGWVVGSSWLLVTNNIAGPYVIKSASGTSYLEQHQSRWIPVNPGFSLSAAADFNNTSSANLKIDVVWYDASFAEIGPSTNQLSSNAALWARSWAHLGVAPTGAAWAKVRIYTASAPNSISVRCRRVKVVVGDGNPGPYSNEATSKALADITADGILSQVEKPLIVDRYNALIAQQSGLDAQASAYGITSERTAYNNAITALTSYITGLSPAYNDYTQATTITRTTFNTRFGDVETTKQALINKIGSMASTGLNNDGTIKTDKVATVAVQNNAITGSANAYTAGSITLTGAYQTIQTITITTTGSPVVVFLSFRAYGSGSVPIVQWRLQRASTDLVTGIGGSSYSPEGFTYSETPSAGTHTYTLQALVSSGSFTANSRSLVALELKK